MRKKKRYLFLHLHILTLYFNLTMQVVYSDDGLLHNPLNEMTGGEWKPYVGKKKKL